MSMEKRRASSYIAPRPDKLRFQFQKRRQLFSRVHLSARPLRDQTHRELVYRPLQFKERGQDFIGAHDETLSVAMRVNNPDRAPLRIHS
jgi:hypothetical protein